MNNDPISILAARLKRHLIAMGRFFVLAFCASLFTACGVDQDPRVVAVSRAVENVIKPANAALTATGADMRSAVDRLCDRPGAKALDNARSAFAGLVAAWSRAEILRLGPMLVDNRLERILFWPDRRSRGLSQVKAAIADANEKTFSPQSLRQMSVAVQGLGALEFVLFGEGSETLGSAADFRCKYAQSITVLLVQNFAALAAEWAAPDGFARDWSTPSVENAHFRTPAESLNGLVGLIFHDIELFRDVRLAGLARMKPGDDNPETVLFWRSNLTARSLRENLSATHDLLNLSGVRSLLREDQQSLMDSIHVEFWKADDILARLPSDISRASLDPAFGSDIQGQEQELFPATR